jgi:hypothetical protein
MNKKQIIALFVAFAFLSLLHVSTMPLHADQAPDQAGTTVSSPEQAPSFIEEEGYGSSPAKKSMMPVILIGLGVAVVAAVLVLVVFKTKYDIVGTWTMTVHWTSPVISGSYETTFTGDKKSGTCSALSNTGTYTVSGSDAKWNLSAATYTGKFSSKTAISGTMSNTSGNSGTFTATKNASTTSIPGGSASAVTGEKTIK